MYIRKKWLICLFIAVIGVIAYAVNQLEIATYILSFLGLAYFYAIKHPKMGSFFAFIFTIYLVLNVTVIDQKMYGISSSIAEFINQYIPVIGKVNENNSMAFLLLLAMILCCILSPVYSFLEKRNLPMGISKNISKEFINDYLKQDICEEMAKKIDQFDKEYNWLDRYFVPLKADVEIKRKSGKRKKVVDLFAALKKCHQKNPPIYLLIGEPGAGKSVALRKLCRELLKEVDESGKIPLYINLKEWKNLSGHLQKGDMPTQEQLVEFILDFLCNGATYSLESELEDKFLSYIQQGRWFFIFDSFDEIPCLLNLQEPELVIEHLSGLLYEFMIQHNCGGILASRPYRSPVSSFKTNVVLTIRPMDEDKINKFFSRYTNNSKRLLKDIYYQKTELINLLRNPFYASLILNYYNHKKKLPSGQTDMFDDFVKMRIDSCAKKLKKAKLTEEDVVIGACSIAHCMFECESGLEIPIDILKKELRQELWIDNVIDILCCAKICRVSEGEESSVTFVHRRFQEYFLVLYFIAHTDLAVTFYADIEHNTRMHDALVLYCEIINDAEAEIIAQHCWDVIQNNGHDYKNIRNKDTLYAVNCMLFLKEAFMNRRNCLQGFLEEFQALIGEVLSTQIDVVCLAKIAECICLFEPAHLDLLLLKVFIQKYSWVNEIALRSCVGFCRLNRKIEYCCYAYLNSLKDKEFLKKYWNFKFIFSTYKSYRVINIYMWLKAFDIIVTWLAYVGIAALIFSGRILDIFYLLTQNKRLFVSYVIVIICFVMMGIIKYTLSRSIILLYLACFLVKIPVVYFVLCIIPIHVIFQFFRIGSVSRELGRSLDNIIEGLKTKNASVFKEIFFIIFGLIFGMIFWPFLESERLWITLGIICGIVLLVIVLKEFLKIFFNMIGTVKYKKYKNRKTNSEIERSVLESDLRHIRSKKEKAAYLDSLNESQVHLSGNWTNNRRPNLKDEEADRLLAMLDIKDLNMKL